MSGTQLCQAGLSPLDKYAGRRHTCQCTSSLSGSTMRSVGQSGLGMMLGSSSHPISVFWDPCADLLFGPQASKGSYPHHHYEHCRVWLRLPPRSQGCVQHGTEQPAILAASLLFVSHMSFFCFSLWAMAQVLISRLEHTLQEATCSWQWSSAFLPGTLSRKP